MSDRLDDQVVWVAGAIGRAVCHGFAQAGARLALSARDGDRLAELAAALPGAGAHILAPCNVADAAQVTATAQAVRRQAGRVDVLVNTTAAPRFGDVLELTDADWLAVFQTKVLAYMRTARAVVPTMIEAGGGAIVNVSGRGGHQPSAPAHLPGSCANGAVNTLTKGLANLYGRHGIRVNAVAPGPVASERYRCISAANQAVAAAGGEAGGGAGRAAGSGPLGDVADPAQVADAIRFLASPRAGFVTGIVLQVDGGGTASL